MRFAFAGIRTFRPWFAGARNQLEVEYQQTPSSATVDDLVQMATPVVSIIEGLLWLFLRPCRPGILAV